MQHLFLDLENNLTKTKKFIQRILEEKDCLEKRLNILCNLISFLKGGNIFYAEKSKTEKTMHREEAVEFGKLFTNSDKISTADALIFFCGCGCDCEGGVWREELDSFLLSNIKKVVLLSTIELGPIKKAQFKKDIQFLWINVCDATNSLSAKQDEIERVLTI